ncbi:hypothetical protein ASD11_02590 [Aeromicrobium sp. Root495]|uniref:DUF6542 domain-containing protein n=1 Tax=Aeromicrobium sp. Root495 TaxID=1736550 RepID=UPI0006F97A1B|nr:DUF6542 domain-containing protein [Aeromicrobium sp. Root495]KQY58567.1 hypothetical protein ASD11_02590 [Aeromicrobium sp. Root495]
MTQVAAPSPARLARLDLTSRQVIWGACAVMGAITALDLLDGALGAPFSVGFVLVVLTAPLAVETGSLFPMGLMPPILLVVALVVVAVLAPQAIAPDGMPADTGRAGRVLAGTIDHGVTLVVGHVLALLAIGLRFMTDRD